MPKRDDLIIGPSQLQLQRRPARNHVSQRLVGAASTNQTIMFSSMTLLDGKGTSRLP